MAPLVEKIYEAFKLAAEGRPEVNVEKGVQAAATRTAMYPKLIRRWMESMEVVGVIDCDGRTIWLVRDYGPRVQRPDAWEIQHKKELEAMKRHEAEVKARARKIRKAERERRSRAKR